MRLLAVVATPQEKDALLRDVRTPCDVVVSGIGPAAAAAATAAALAAEGYDACLSVGICGAFRGTADIGDIVVATELVAADLGADSPTGFLGLDALGWAESTVPVDPSLRDAAVARLTPVVTGPVLTVSTATGTRARADELAARHGGVGEAMEGWGVLEAARRHALPVLEVRAVSNLVGDRDTSTWDFPRAFGTLSRIGAALLGTPWR